MSKLNSMSRTTGLDWKLVIVPTLSRTLDFVGGNW